MKNLVVVSNGGKRHTCPPSRRVWTKVKSLIARMVKKYGIVMTFLTFFILYSVVLKWRVEVATEKRVKEECEAEYELALESYKEQMRQEEIMKYSLSEEAQKEMVISQQINAVAGAIARLSTDQQKLTEASCMLARVMNPIYPNSFKEVVDQPQQWTMYDGTDKTYSMHDRELAEQIVRPYLESGIIPNGLSSDMVFGSWSTNDFVLRDSFESKSVMNTWRYQG